MEFGNDPNQGFWILLIAAAVAAVLVVPFGSLELL